MENVHLKICELLNCKVKCLLERKERRWAISRKWIKNSWRPNLWIYLPVSMTFSCLSASLWVQTVSVRWSSASASFAQHHADLRIHQQSYDEGNVEGGHRWVHHEGRIGKATCGAFTAGCREDKQENANNAVYKNSETITATKWTSWWACFLNNWNYFFLNLDFS